MHAWHMILHKVWAYQIQIELEAWLFAPCNNYFVRMRYTSRYDIHYQPKVPTLKFVLVRVVV